MSRIRAAVLYCGLTLASVPSAMAASVNVPATETFKATAIGVSVTLPSDRGGEAGGKSGVRYEVVAPGNVEILSIYMTTTSESLSAPAPQLTALVRKTGRRL
jgi:hypothetical protein